MSIYKIDHYYNKHRNQCKYAIFIETDIEAEKLAKILGAIQLKFETIQEEHDCIDEQHLLELLKNIIK